MRTKLWRDSLENEAMESWSFRVQFSGGDTLYVQIPGEWHIRDESSPSWTFKPALCS